MTAELEQDNEKKLLEIDMKQSAYYRMFMSEDIYREACYRCQYATIDKPADITLGDYYEAKDDYPELFDGTVQSLRMEDGLSCVITHNRAGDILLHEISPRLCIIPVDIYKVQKSHRQLCKPSMYSLDRNRYFNMYKHGGYLKIEKFLVKRDALKSGLKALLGKKG